MITISLPGMLMTPMIAPADEGECDPWDGKQLQFVGVDLDGRRLLRTKTTHPYNYDTFTMWNADTRKKANGSCYSDRLFGWDPKKHDDLCMKHFGNCGQYWNERDPSLIEAFLRDYHNKPNLLLIKIEECCNQSSGYPLWHFSYNS